MLSEVILKKIFDTNLICKQNTVVPPYPKEPQWMPEASYNTEPYLDRVFFFFPLYGFSLAYQNCKHHYSCALRQLSKIRVIRI